MWPTCQGCPPAGRLFREKAGGRLLGGLLLLLLLLATIISALLRCGGSIGASVGSGGRFLGLLLLATWRRKVELNEIMSQLMNLKSPEFHPLLNFSSVH